MLLNTTAQCNIGICFEFRYSDFEFNAIDISIYIILPYKQCSTRSCAVVLSNRHSGQSLL